jgi:hypothetical protein
MPTEDGYTAQRRLRDLEAAHGVQVYSGDRADGAGE